MFPVARTRYLVVAGASFLALACGDGATDSGNGGASGRGGQPSFAGSAPVVVGGAGAAAMASGGAGAGGTLSGSAGLGGAGGTAGVGGTSAGSGGTAGTSAGTGGAPMSPMAMGDGIGRHPFLYAGEWDTRKPDMQSMFIVRDGKVVWQYSMPLHNAAGGTQEFDDATLLPNGNVVYSHMSGASMVSPEKKVVWDYLAPAGTEVHSCQFLGGDRVLIMRNGNPAQAMIINTATSTTEKVIPIPTTVTGTHGQFRHIRMTPAGTILVGHMSEGKVVEYDLDGKVVWQVAANNAWSAIRLTNGNTLIAGDGAKYAREVDHDGKTVWEFKQADVPDIKLGNTQYAMRMLNGNTVITSWIAGDNDTSHWAGTIQALEVTPDKKIVWKLSSWQDPDLGPATSIQLLDEPDAPEHQQR
jgi:hypothetical protein